MFGWLIPAPLRELGQFAGDHAIVGVALLIAAAGIAARLMLPMFARQAATLLWICAAAIGAYGEGYATAKRGDRTAQLQNRIAQLEQDAKATLDVVNAANGRAVVAERDRDSNVQRVIDYEVRLAKLGDCALSDDDRVSLRGLDPRPARPSAAAARRPARARAAAGPVKGAKALLAEHRAALIAANGKIERWNAFYADVMREFGAP